MAKRRGAYNGQIIYEWLKRMVRADKERFIARLSGAVERVPDSECIIYKHTGGQTQKGYRRISVTAEFKVLAHHVFWTLANCRPIPDGMEIDHWCNNPPCINPVHLRDMTPQENTDRRNHG